MQKLIFFIFICFFSFLSNAQTLQPSYEPVDLIGAWEYNIPNTQDYIQFYFRQPYEEVSGEFKKISKDSNGNVITEHFNSEAYNTPYDYTKAAMSGIQTYDVIPEPNTFGSMFIDRGISNNNPEAELIQMCTLKIYKPCANCDPEIHFTLLPKNPGVGRAANRYQINIPVNMVLTKVM
jgi:hypothetical protein